MPTTCTAALLFLVFYCSCNVLASPVATDGDIDIDQGSASNKNVETIEERIDMKELGVQYSLGNGTMSFETVEKLIETYQMARRIKVTKIPQHVEVGQSDSQKDARQEAKKNARGKRLTFGVDERIPVPNDYSNKFPYCTIGQLDNGPCTVVFIGPYHALTAASCIYDTVTNTVRDIKTITFQRNCKTAGTTVNLVTLHTTIEFIVNENNAYNYALLITNSSTPVPCYAGFGFITEWLNRGFDIIGYPIDKTIFQVPECDHDSLYSSSCHFSNLTANQLQYTYRCDTQGTYGAPLFSEVPGEHAAYIGQRIVYGLHSHFGRTFRQWNFGTRITRERFIRIIRWMIGSGYNPLE